jgi:tetratricopeptide (TPR) repeat protein
MKPSAFTTTCLAVCITLSVGSLRAAPAVPARQSDGRLVKVVELLLTQRLTEAKAAAQEAQQVFQRSGDRHREALSLLLLGYSDFVTADFVAAADHLDHGAARLEELGDGLGTWTAVWLSGMLDAKLGRAEQAIVHQRRALELARGLGASAAPLSGPGLEPLAGLLTLSDDLVQALRTRPAAARPALAQITELLTRDHLLEALLETGRLDEAEAELPRFAELSRRLEGISNTSVALRLGDLRRRQWRLDEAREVLRRALAGGDRFKTEAQDLEILDSLTELEIAGGRFEEALAWSDQALARARRRAEPNAVANALVMRAAALKRAQRLDEAELALREALDLWHNAGNAYREATARSQLGFLALRRNRYETAAVEFEAALRLLGEVDAPAAEAQVWIQLFLIYFRFQVPGSVSTALEKTLADSERTDQQLARAKAGLLSALERSWRKTAGDGDLVQHLTVLLEQPEVKESFRPEDRRTLLRVLSELWTGAVRSDSSSTAEDGDLERGTDLRLRYPGLIPLAQGLKRFQRGELAAARKAWRVALAESPRRELEIQLLAAIGLSFEKEGKIAKAIRSLARAIDAVERMVEEVRVEELLAGLLGSDSTQSLYDRLLALLMRQGRTAEAFEVTERARARAFLLGLGNRRGLSPLTRSRREMDL